MATLGSTALLRCLLLSAILALVLFLTSVWLLLFSQPQPPLVEPGGAPPFIKECPGQSFQAWRLLRFLTSSVSVADDVLLEPYLQSWDQLIIFMESLGPVVSFFSQKVNEKMDLIRQQVALAPHHSWVLRQAAELVFLALPDREYFLRLVCAQSQHEAEPVLRILISALQRVHSATERILEQHAMLDLP